MIAMISGDELRRCNFNSSFFKEQSAIRERQSAFAYKIFKQLKLSLCTLKLPGVSVYGSVFTEVKLAS